LFLLKSSQNRLMQFAQKRNDMKYEIWKVLISYANYKFSRFRTFYTLKTSLERKKNFRLSRGVAGGYWMKFEAQLAQP
jgi:hypothetical protein